MGAAADAGGARAGIDTGGGAGARSEASWTICTSVKWRKKGCMAAPRASSLEIAKQHVKAAGAVAAMSASGTAASSAAMVSALSEVAKEAAIVTRTEGEGAISSSCCWAGEAMRLSARAYRARCYALTCCACCARARYKSACDQRARTGKSAFACPRRDHQGHRWHALNPRAVPDLLLSYQQKRTKSPPSLNFRSKVCKRTLCVGSSYAGGC